LWAGCLLHTETRWFPFRASHKTNM
jgi:hypothetical protein